MNAERKLGQDQRGRMGNFDRRNLALARRDGRRADLPLTMELTDRAITRSVSQPFGGRQRRVVRRKLVFAVVRSVVLALTLAGVMPGFVAASVLRVPLVGMAGRGWMMDSAVRVVATDQPV